MEKLVFETRRSFRRIWIIMAGFGVFIPIGAVLFITTGERAALAAAAFGLVPVLYMLFRVIAPGSRYEAGPDGLLLKHGGSSRLVSFGDIRGAAVLSGEQAEKALKKYMEPAVESERERDIKEWLASSRAYGYFTRFCTVPIVQEYTTRGSRRNIVKFGTRLEGSFVILKLTSGEEFLLSPADSGGLFTAVASRTRLSDTTPDSSFSWTPDAERRKKLRGFFKWYTRIALVAALLAVAGIYLYSTKAAPEEQVPAAQWIDEETFRYPVRGEIETPVRDPEERQKALTEAVRAAVRPALTGQLALWYCSEKGFDPEGAEYVLLLETLDSLLSRMESDIAVEPQDERTTSVTVTMEYSGPELRGLLEELMDEILAGTGK